MIKDKCSCGSEFFTSQQYPSVEASDHKRWLDAHAGCRVGLHDVPKTENVTDLFEQEAEDSHALEEKDKRDTEHVVRAALDLEVDLSQDDIRDIRRACNIGSKTDLACLLYGKASEYATKLQERFMDRLLEESESNPEPIADDGDDFC